MRTTIWVTTTFEAYHRWPEAPASVGFLQNFHRHIFHVRVEFLVTKDRQLEFFLTKWAVTAYLNETFAGRYMQSSCEVIAGQIFAYCKELGHVVSVTVSEDGENGATVSES